jgi:protein-serine/threonine kinase
VLTYSQYAMLAGYLPFDDDPANPEGDNINLLYKYIVSTPLTFPEYVTPHARDLLKRILVPDPRKRADLFEVARHSWLSEYAHVVGFITSSTTSPNDISNTTVPSGKLQYFLCYTNHSNLDAEDAYEPPHLARSASVREPSKAAQNHTVSTLGGLSQKQGQIDEKPKTTRDAKRRTVQVEYVAPQSSTTRGDGAASSAAAAAAAAQAKTRARSESNGPVEVSTSDGYHSASRQRTTAAPSAMQPPATRPGREAQRAASESVTPSIIPVNSNSTRPSTGGSMSAGSRLPGSRGNSYGQPAVGVAREQAQGRFSQPRGTQYPATGGNDGGYMESSSRRESALYQDEQPQREAYPPRAHKRSSTISELGGRLFGKRNSIFESKGSSNDATKAGRSSRPPVSMTKPIANDAGEPRRSTDSRRTSFSFGRKTTSSKEQDTSTSHRSSRRFSFIPASLANTFGSNRNSQQYPPGSTDSLDQRQQSRSRNNSRPRIFSGRGESRSPSRSTTASNLQNIADQQYDRSRDSPRQRGIHTSAPAKQRYSSADYPPQESYLSGDNTQFASQTNEHGDYYRNVSNPVPATDDQYDDHYAHQDYQPQYPAGFNSFEQDEQYPQPRKEKHVLQKPNRKFPESYEKDGHTSGRAQRVMDFFKGRRQRAVE